MFLGIVLLSFFLAPAVATVFVLHYQKMQVKKEVKRKIIAGIDEEELVLLKFTEEEKSRLDWEHANEFTYQSQSYDIVSAEVVGDTTYYRCWWDYEETQLNRQLDESVALALENNSHHKENKIRLFRFLEHLYFSKPIEEKSFAVQEVSANYFFAPDFYQSVVLFPPAPPPEIG